MKATLPRLPLVVAIGLRFPRPHSCAAPIGRTARPGTGRTSAGTPSGQNLAWKAPDGRTIPGPVILAIALPPETRLAKAGATQERLMRSTSAPASCFAEQYTSTRVTCRPHRIAWASPVVDAASGNVFAFARWNRPRSAVAPRQERSLAEGFACWIRNVDASPCALLMAIQSIVSGLMFSWGQHAGGAHRYISFEQINRTRQLD